MKRFVLAAGAICILPLSILADLEVGKIYRISLTDVDGNSLSTADGHTSVLTLTNQANTERARAVADRIPDFCVGNPQYRMITILLFEKKHSKPVRAILGSLIRHRLDSEAKRLQTRYDNAKINRTARGDVFAVADFDGAVAAQLDAKFEAGLFRVFVFGKTGELLKRWNDVPTAEELAAALKRD
jgi:hypothetical protein